jgi:DNA polymerase V
VPQSQVGVVKNWLGELAELNTVINQPRSLPDLDRLAAAGLTRLLPCEINAMLPLVLYSGRIAAGFPSPADDYADERIDLNRHLIRHKEATFFLRVQGDSMLGAGIHDGDLLIVDRAIDATDGKVVIASLDGELTVKRLSVRGETVRLMPENPAYPVIEVKSEQDLVIWGVVTNVIHALG